MSGESNSPWRQPILWLVLGMPAAMVVAGVFLVRSAIGLGSLDATADRVERTAQVQTTDLTADLAARQAGLTAVLMLENGFIRVQALSGDFPHAQPLSLLLQHPIDTRADRVLVLQPDGEGWRVAWTLERGHDWILELTPANRNWRLHGRWLRGEEGTRLQPSLRNQEESSARSADPQEATMCSVVGLRCARPILLVSEAVGPRPQESGHAIG